MIWRRQANRALEELYGSTSGPVRDFDSIVKSMEAQGLPSDAHWLHAREFFTEMIGRAEKEKLSITPMQTPQSTKKVFIVHGHDDLAKFELQNFLRKLGLEPLILHEQDDGGLTIIEKFELHANQCSFAFILLTPDDSVGKEASVEMKWRARQNVIMELGWFMAKLGRSRVTMLHKGAVEIPTDISGVLYLPFKQSVMEVSERIRQRLTAAKLLAS